MCSDYGLRIGNKYVEKSVFEMKIIMICFNNNINVVVFYFLSGGDRFVLKFLVKCLDVLSASIFLKFRKAEGVAIHFMYYIIIGPTPSRGR